MTDDIVNRLRRRAGWCWHGIDPDGAYQPYPRPESCERCNELCEIADEIERLRADLENVRDMNEKLTEELQTYYSEDELNADWE